MNPFLGLRGALVATALMGAASASAAPTSAPDLGEMSRRLDPYLGCWTIAGRELDTSGDTFSQTGVAIVRRDSATAGLRFDERFHVTEASGNYRRLPRERRFSELLYFDPATQLFAVRDVDDPVRPPTRVSVAADGAASRTFMFRSTARNLDLLASHYMRFASGDRLEVRTRIRDPHGTFEEFYVAVWTRVDQQDPRCKTARG